MSRPQKKQPQQREAPIQFRPGSELGHLVRTFAGNHGLTPPEACRLLISLAVAEMDCRFAGLVLPLAGVMGGENAYVRASEHVHTALQAARRATNYPLHADPERAGFIQETVRAALAERGAGESFKPLAFLAAGSAAPGVEEGGTSQTRSPEKRPRTLRHKVMDDIE